MKGRPGQKYNKEFKDSILRRMMPPENVSIAKLSEETGVTETTLYKWRNEARIKGYATPGDGRGAESWSTEDKFLIVMETYSMNEEELSAFCRSKGLYKEQIEAWRDACKNANGRELSQTRQLSIELREEKKRAKLLEKDLQIKEKALAETAALLILRKKARAIWGDPEDE